MNTKNILAIFGLIFACILALPVVHADLITPPGQLFFSGAIALLLVGAVLGAIAWICWLIIRKIRSKNAPVTKDTAAVDKNVRK
jgi:protein-S-isoprenylcysteine O-methyltransferase Ste14